MPLANVKECEVCKCNFRVTPETPEKCDRCTKLGLKPPRRDDDVLTRTLSQKMVQEVAEKAALDVAEKTIEKYFELKKCSDCDENFVPHSPAQKRCRQCIKGKEDKNEKVAEETK